MNQPSLSTSTRPMREYVATKTFVLGSTNVTLSKGMVILFDGATIEVDGIQYRALMMRGAIKARWVVPIEEYDEQDASYDRGPRAEIRVSPAIGGNPLDRKPRTEVITTESDERYVGNVKAAAKQTSDRNKNYVRGSTVAGVQPGQIVKTQRGMMEVEVQDGVELDRRLQTPVGDRAKNERIDMTSHRAAEAMRLARDVAIQPGEGVSEDDMLARMTPEQRQNYLSEKDALRARYVEDSPGGTAHLPRPATTQVVARVRTAAQTQQHDGMTVRNSTRSGSLSVGDETDGTIVGRVTHDVHGVVDQEGIRFQTTNLQRSAPPVAPTRLVASASAPPPVPANLDIRRKIAKAVCSDFPENYDFSLSPKKKIARLQADYEDRADVLQAVFAAESDDMKALLLQEFPSAFTQPQ